jgi:vancomycin permeability regulator SanA
MIAGLDKFREHFANYKVMVSEHSIASRNPKWLGIR